MQTSPAPLDSFGPTGAGMGEYRVAEPREIASMLRALCDGNVPVNLNASDGSVFTTTLWTLDGDRGTIAFTADVADTRMQSILECEEATVVGYLNNVKVQFEVANLVLVRGSRAAVLSCAAPRQMFRFQRRNAFRVRPLMRSAPTARLALDDNVSELALRVVDVSIGGCAVFLPDDVPAPQPGLRLQRCEVDLDADTRFKVDMRLQHVTAMNADARGVRLGFEFLRASGEALRALQRFIDQTQKRGKLLALD